LTDTTFERVAFPVVADAGLQARVASAEVRGHAAGYAAGLRAAHAVTEALRAELEAAPVARLERLESETARRLAALSAAADALLARAVPVLESAEQSVVDAAMELAEAAVGYAIRASRPGSGAESGADSGAVTGLEARPASGAEATVRRALALVDHTVAIAVRLSPADAAAVARLDLPVPVRADAALRDGDAVVDLPDGVLDARIGAALARAKAALGVTA
jgi:flagellar assembly protein FliH